MLSVIVYVLAAFVGCFSALVALEVTAAVLPKWVRYLAALLLGVVVCFVLGWILSFVASIFAKVPH